MHHETSRTSLCGPKAKKNLIKRKKCIAVFAFVSSIGMRSYNKYDLELLAHIEAFIIHIALRISHFISFVFRFADSFTLFAYGMTFSTNNSSTHKCVCLFAFTTKAMKHLCVESLFFLFFLLIIVQRLLQFSGPLLFWSNYLKQDPKVQRLIYIYIFLHLNWLELNFD